MKPRAETTGIVAVGAVACAACCAGPLLGLLAGLGYAGSAISVRGVGTPVELAVVLNDHSTLNRVKMTT